MDKAHELDEYDPKLLKASAGDYVHTIGLASLGLALAAIIPGGQVLAALAGTKALSPMLKRLDMRRSEERYAMRS